MWIQFILENAHFGLNIFGALIMFAVAWLYLDAWTVRHNTREAIRTIGFILLSLSFILHATNIESELFTQALIPVHIHTLLLFFTRVPAYILIIISLILEPLQPKPIHEPEKPMPGQANGIAFFAASTSVSTILSTFLYPLLALTAAGLFLRRATIGLERHLYKVSVSFILLGLSELLSLRILFLPTTNVDLFNLMTGFGPIWIVEHILLFISLLFLAWWVFSYLVKRFETELFMIFVITILSIFLITTVTFTGLLVSHLVTETLQELQIDVNVLSLSIDSKKGEALSDAELIAQDPRVIAGIGSNDRRGVAQLLATYLLTKKQSSLIIVDLKGTVLASGEDIDRYGYSLSSDVLVKSALSGDSVSSLEKRDGVIAPVISVKAATPIKSSDNRIIGVAVASTVLDEALLDGIKKATGLDASLYGDNQLSATTIVGPDGITRPIGTKEENGQIKFMVLGKNKPYADAINLLSRPYFGSYLPITNVDNTPIGMLFVGKPQVGVLATAGKSIELTFLITGLLMILSILPAFLISRFIVRQIH